MNDKPRTNNVVRNMWVGTFFQVFSILLGFISRTIFIKILGSEYLGLNSLFTNVLTILSLAELGISNAIIFNMYKPIAENDIPKLKKIVVFYKRTYALIGLIVLLLGLLILPFLPTIIAEVPKIKESIYLIYTLFLVDTTISYFFYYKSSVIMADQKNYVVVTITYIFKIGQIILQLLILFLTKEYILYLILQLLNTLLTNIFLARKATKMYPFLKNLGKDSLEKKEKKKIFANVRALFINKISYVVLNGTDSIIISKYLGLAVLGLYSNYYLLINAISQILSQLFNSFTSSIGNLIASKDSFKSKEVFLELHYFTAFIYTVVAISLYLLFNDFVTIWLGEEYLLTKVVVLTIVTDLYIKGVQFSGTTFRSASGNFRYFRYMPIVGAIINVVISIILAQKIGLAGIFIGTFVSRLVTTTWVDPYVVYKNIFKENVFEYFLKYFKYLVILLICFIPCYFVSKYLTTISILFFILKGFIYVFLTTSIFIILTFKTNEFKALKGRAMFFLRKLRKV